MGTTFRDETCQMKEPPGRRKSTPSFSCSTKMDVIIWIAKTEIVNVFQVHVDGSPITVYSSNGTRQEKVKGPDFSL
jgi:hypothetical protein